MKMISGFKKETLLKILIFIGIITIIVSLYIQYGKPYIKELSLQKQDEQRIKDLGVLSTVMEDMISASSTQVIGKNNTIYISLPSDDTTCSNLDLPSVPNGWQYHCVATSALEKTDGTGWIPVKLSEKIKQLPVDPINDPETLNYYAYIASSTKEYVIVSALDSRKYLKEKLKMNDGGVDDLRYEIGNNHALESYSNGLIGLWPMNENAGNIFKDKSMRNSDTSIFGKINWNANLFYFDGESNYVFIKDTPKTSNIGSSNSSYTISVWIKPVDIKNESITEKWLSKKYPWAIRIEGGQIVFGLYDGKNWTGSFTKPPFKIEKKWVNIVAIKDAYKKETSLYIDGYLVSTNPLSLEDTNLSNNLGFTVGSRNLKNDSLYNGYMRDFAIFDRVLSGNEILRMYRSSK